MNPKPKQISKSVWRVYGFRLIIAASFISMIGDVFRNNAMNYWVYSFTHGNTQSRLLAMVLTSLPAILFGFLAGVIADRYNRVRVLVCCDLIRCILSALLALCAYFQMIAPSFGIVFVNAIFGVFFSSASIALLPRVVSEDQVGQANSIEMASIWTVQVITPTLAAFSFVYLGPGFSFVIDAISFIFSALILKFLPASARVIAEDKQNERGSMRLYLADLREGASYLLHHRTAAVFLLECNSILFLTMTYNFSLLYLENREMHYSLQIVGLFNSYTAIIAVISSVVTARFVKNQLGRVFFWTTIIIFLACFIVGAAPNLWILLFAMAIIALANAPLNIAVMSLLQSTIHTDFLGRISGIYQVITGLLTILSYCFAAFMVAEYNARIAIITVSILCFVLFVIFHTIKKTEVEESTNTANEINSEQ